MKRSPCFAICATAGGTSKTGTGTTSPITVSSLINGVLYSCTVTAANAVGSSVASGAVTVTPIAGTTGSSLNAAYKNVAWQKGVTVTFPTDCTMTYTSKGMPSVAASTHCKTAPLRASFQPLTLMERVINDGAS